MANAIGFEALVTSLAADAAHFKVRTVAKTGRKRKVFLPTLELVAAYIRRLPPKETVDVQSMKNNIAKAAGADLCCPVTTRMLLAELAKRSPLMSDAREQPDYAPR